MGEKERRWLRLYGVGERILNLSGVDGDGHPRIPNYQKEFGGEESERGMNVMGRGTRTK